MARPAHLTLDFNRVIELLLALYFHMLDRTTVLAFPLHRHGGSDARRTRHRSCRPTVAQLSFVSCGVTHLALMNTNNRETMVVAMSAPVEATPAPIEAFWQIMS